MNRRQFTYTHGRNLPFIPLTLYYGDRVITRDALVDSGATNNVLPYHIGLELGLSWEAQTFGLNPVDILRGAPVVGVKLSAEVTPFPPCDMVWAWTQKDDMPLILGHMNFFLEFDVHFYDTQGMFEIAVSGDILHRDY